MNRYIATQRMNLDLYASQFILVNFRYDIFLFGYNRTLFKVKWGKGEAVAKNGAKHQTRQWLSKRTKLVSAFVSCDDKRKRKFVS